MKKKIVCLLIASMCALSAIACGKQETAVSTSGGVDFDIVDPIDVIDNPELAEVVTMPETIVEETPSEPIEEEVEAYFASEEIKNAQLGANLLQIGDDLFQEGGYITYKEFVEQYGDKYDCSALSLDGFMTKGAEFFHFKKIDSEIELSVLLVNPGSKDTQTGAADLIVGFVSPHSKYAKNNTWMPTGIPIEKDGIAELAMTHDDIVQLIKDTGAFTECSWMYSHLDAGVIEDKGSEIKINFPMQEKNLLGYYPVIGYVFSINSSQNTFVSVSSFWSKSSMGKSMIENDSYVGIPVMQFAELSDEELDDLYEAARKIYAEEEKMDVEDISIYGSCIQSQDSKTTIDGTEYELTNLVVVVEVAQDDGSTKYSYVRLQWVGRGMYDHVYYNSAYCGKLSNTAEDVINGTKDVIDTNL